MAWSRARAARKIAGVKAQMCVADRWSEVTIANVSATGLLAKCAQTPVVGAEVELRRRSMIITGRVVWANGTRFGIQSLGAIDVGALLARSELQADRRSTARGNEDRRGAARWWWQLPR
jgi:hypothetical protein